MPRCFSVHILLSDISTEFPFVDQNTSLENVPKTFWTNKICEIRSIGQIKYSILFETWC